MSIIGNALMGGVGDGMRAYAGQMQQEQVGRDRREELSMKLKAERDDLLLRLQAQREEGKANRDNAIAVAEARNVSQYERRPDLYGADSKPVDRSKFEKDETTYSRTDDSEYSDAVSRKNAPLIETVKKTYDEAGHKKAEADRIQGNIDRKTQVDSPANFDDQQRGRGRSIVVRELEKDPNSTAAAAASMAVEGKARFSQSGGNTVLDGATGKATTTEVGESVITKNERPPAPKPAGSGKGGGKGDDANARALVTSLRTQASNASKSIDKLSEGFVTPQKQKMIDEKKAELAAINARLAEAEKSLAKPTTSQGDNARPAVAKPATKAEYDKLPRGARYVAPDGTTRTKG